MSQNYDLIIATIRLLCPYLQDMANRTATPIDNLVVDFICHLVSTQEGGDQNG